MSNVPGWLAAQLGVSSPFGLHLLGLQLAVCLPEQSVGMSPGLDCSLLPGLGNRVTALTSRQHEKYSLRTRDGDGDTGHMNCVHRPDQIKGYSAGNPPSHGSTPSALS